MKLIIGLFIVLMTQSSMANYTSQVSTCDSWVTDMRFIVEPWSDHTKTFYNGKVRIVHIDTMGEPVCCSSRLLIFMPDSTDPLGGQKCFQVVGNSGNGYEWLDFKNISASYSPVLGLLLNIPVTFYGNGLFSVLEVAKVRLNLSLETATIE